MIEAPNTEPMTAMADALRALAVGQHPSVYIAATACAAAEVMELQTDWLHDQHRLIVQMNELNDQLLGAVRELTDIINRRKGEE